jgi:hypothetical protein
MENNLARPPVGCRVRTLPSAFSVEPALGIRHRNRLLYQFVASQKIFPYLRASILFNSNLCSSRGETCTDYGGYEN